jgi:hypothetical protein
MPNLPNAATASPAGTLRLAAKSRDKAQYRHDMRPACNSPFESAIRASVFGGVLRAAGELKGWRGISWDDPAKVR